MCGEKKNLEYCWMYEGLWSGEKGKFEKLLDVCKNYEVDGGLESPDRVSV